jgi:uncharacterized protein YlbG (UPF0298 family)
LSRIYISDSDYAHRRIVFVLLFVNKQQLEQSVI